MSEKKTISINPLFLKLQNNSKTRKKKGDNQATPIRMKTATPHKNNTIRRRLLDHLRRQQEENYKQLIDKPATAAAATTNRPSLPKMNPDISDFKSDFEHSLDYLENLAKETDMKRQVHNATLRSHTPHRPTNTIMFHEPVTNHVLNHPTNAYTNNTNHIGDNATFTSALSNITGPGYSPVNMSSRSVAGVAGVAGVGSSGISPYENVLMGDMPEDAGPPIQIHQPKMPSYGCLKNGNLPTYRNWKTQTQKAPAISSGPGIYQAQQHPPQQTSIISPSPSVNSYGSIYGKPQHNMQEIRKYFEKRRDDRLIAQSANRARKYMQPSQKQKRIMRRTFHIGKSRIYPKVGVLVSNRTLRNRTQVKCQELKKIPIEEVRKYLIKKGLIRVGSTCPNDVLRKMYESANLLCGEVQNHNPDNLLYNYLNGGI